MNFWVQFVRSTYLAIFKMLIYFSLIDFSLKNEVNFFLILYSFHFLKKYLFIKNIFQINSWVCGLIHLFMGFYGRIRILKRKFFYFMDCTYVFETQIWWVVPKTWCILCMLTISLDEDLSLLPTERTLYLYYDRKRKRFCADFLI